MTLQDYNAHVLAEFEERCREAPPDFRVWFYSRAPHVARGRGAR